MLDIVDIAMLSPMGNVEQTVAAVNAGINIYQNIPVVEGMAPIIRGEIPDDALASQRQDNDALSSIEMRRARIIQIARASLAPLIARAKFSQPAPVLFTGPEKIPGFRTPIDDRYLERLLQPFSEQLDIENSFVFPFGRAAISPALTKAKALLASGKYKEVIVGGADTYFDPEYIEHLGIQGRLLAPGALEGFVPSEAGVFLVLRLSSSEAKPAAGQIIAWADHAEQAHRYVDTPHLGEALSHAACKAFNELEGIGRAGLAISAAFPPLNGESFFAKEWGVCRLRNHAHFDNNLRIIHPADCLGDVGSAWGAMMIALANADQSLNHVLVCAASELETRASVLMSVASSHASTS